MLKKQLSNFNLILASGSPRRQNFFKELDLEFKIEVREIQESYPDHLQAEQITDYLAKLKASAFSNLDSKDIVITSDTIVWMDGKAIGKPKGFDDAKNMLHHLSGSMHEVITSVCFTSKNFQEIINDKTNVWFKNLTDDEIDYYLHKYKPYDKAGSYGIQEWIGYIGIERIEGSYFNVMGLPTRLVYKALGEITAEEMLKNSQ
jgi:septum formation protein